MRSEFGDPAGRPASVVRAASVRRRAKRRPLMPAGVTSNQLWDQTGIQPPAAPARQNSPRLAGTFNLIPPRKGGGGAAG